MVVDLSTIHHEGGGAPASSADIGRIAHGGYTYGIGKDGWTRFRSVEDSYATLNYNHVSLDICLSGDRHTGYPVTDADIQAIHGAYMDAYNRGEVTQNPLVRPHKDSPGSATACPGNNTMARWQAVANAVRYTVAPPQPKPPEESEMQTATTLKANGHPETFSLMPDGTIWHQWREPGGSWSQMAKFSQGPFDSLSAWTNENGCIEVLGHHKTRGFLHRWQVNPNNGWSEWADL